MLCRASDFIVALLHRLHDDAEVSLSTAASDAYYKTLYNNHTWYTSAAFVVILKVHTAAESLSLCPESCLRSTCICSCGPLGQCLEVCRQFVLINVVMTRIWCPLTDASLHLLGIPEEQMR